MTKLNTTLTETRHSEAGDDVVHARRASPGGSYTSHHSPLGFLKCDIMHR